MMSRNRGAAGSAAPGSGKQAPGYGSTHYNRNGMTRTHWLETIEHEQSITGKTPRTVKAFVERLVYSGVWYHLQALGFDPAGPAAVMLHEADYGLSYACKTYDNLLGISYTDRSSGTPVDRPYIFDSVPHCLEFFDTMMGWTLYKRAREARRNASAFVTELHEAGYNSSEQWYNGVSAALLKIKEYLPK